MENWNLNKIFGALQPDIKNFSGSVLFAWTSFVIFDMSIDVALTRALIDDVHLLTALHFRYELRQETAENFQQ